MEFTRLPADIRLRYLYRFMGIRSFIRYTSISHEYRKIYSTPRIWEYFIERDFSVEYRGIYGRPLYILFYQDPALDRLEVISILQDTRVLPMFGAIRDLSSIHRIYSGFLLYRYNTNPNLYFNFTWKINYFTLELRGPWIHPYFNLRCDISRDIPSLPATFPMMIDGLKRLPPLTSTCHASIINLIVPFLLSLNFRYVRQYLEPDLVRYEYQTKDGRSAYISFYGVTSTSVNTLLSSYRSSHTSHIGPE